MAYIEVPFIDIYSPFAEGLYEEENGVYFLSEDEEPYEDTIYYMYDDAEEAEDDSDCYVEVEVGFGEDVEGYFEYVNGEYVLTEDTVAQSGKHYFDYFDRSTTDVPIDEEPFYYALDESDEITNPVGQHLYEYTEEGYVLSEDTVPDSVKTYYRYVDPAVIEDIAPDEESPAQDVGDYVNTGVQEKQETVPYVQSDNFLFAYMRFVEDPNAEGLYEIVDGSYVLTSDTEVVRGKVYYEYSFYSDYYEADMTGVSNPYLSLINFYEVLEGSYVLTRDTTVASGKTYYRSHKEDRTRYLPDPSIGQEPASYDDIPFEE